MDADRRSEPSKPGSTVGASSDVDRALDLVCRIARDIAAGTVAVNSTGKYWDSLREVAEHCGAPTWFLTATEAWLSEHGRTWDDIPALSAREMLALRAALDSQGQPGLSRDVQ